MKLRRNRWVLSLLVWVIAAPVFGDVYEVCDSFTFDSDTRKCLEAVRGKQFDDKVLPVCAAMTFDSDKLSCLKAVADRFFVSSTEVRICGEQTFASDKLTCLKNANTTPFTADQLTLDKVKRAVSSALRAIRRHEYREARYVLEDLLQAINEVP